MTHRRAFLISMLTLPCLLSVSCKPGNDTSIIIHVVSDESLGLNAVDMTARSVSRDPDAGRDMGTKSEHFTEPSKVTWTLFPAGSDKMFAVEVTARGMQNASSDPVVVQRAVVAFQNRKHVEITMSLDRACLGVSCVPMLTCQYGDCIDPAMVGTATADGGTVDVLMDTGSRDAASEDGRSDGADGSREGGLTDGALLKMLGVACQSSAECGSNHCVDGVCCNDACGGSCQSCDSTVMPGYCVAVTSGQPAPTKRAPCAKDLVATCKQTGLCDGKGSCQLYADGEVCQAVTCNATTNTITSSRCDGMGACKAEMALSCAPFRCKAGEALCARTCAANTDCDGQPCVAASCGKLKIGAVCAADTECELGFCVDSVCCDVRCSGTCQACNLSGSVGTCSSVKSGQPVGGRTACTGSGPCGGTCNGQAECSYPAPTASCRAASCDVSTLTAAANCNGAGACPALSTSICPNHLRCQTGTAVCLAQCASNADCLPGFFCSGTTCTASKVNGTACVTGTECTSNLCVDKVCCNAACNSNCQTCATGTCATVASADDADTCTGTNTCNGTGACLKKQAQACVVDADCSTGQCADGVCCNRDCGGSCEACSGVGVPVPGTCTFTVGAARHAPLCTGTGTCAATCRGQTAACVFPGAELSCRSAGCSVDLTTATAAAACDSLGNCPGPATTPCSPFTCQGTTCATRCTANSQCAVGFACIGTSCAACAAGQTICPGVSGCVSLTTDGNNCGACGHSCLGGTCGANSTCSPVLLATFPGLINGLAVNSTTVFTFLGTADSSAFSVYGVTKTAQNLTAAPLATVTPGTSASGYLGASDTLFIWEAFTGNQAGKFSTVYSCDPRNCQATLQTWFSVVNNNSTCDPVTQKCFTQAQSPSANEVRVAMLGTASQTAPQSFTPPLNIATGFGLTATGGFLYMTGPSDPVLQLPVLERVPEDSGAVKTRLANFSPVSNQLLGPIVATSSKVFFQGQTTDAGGNTTVGIMSVALPFGVGDSAPSFLAGTTRMNAGFFQFWADDSAVFFFSAAQQIVTCPATGCGTNPRALADATTANRVMVGDSQAIYWIVPLTSTSAAIMKVAR